MNKSSVHSLPMDAANSLQFFLPNDFKHIYCITKNDLDIIPHDISLNCREISNGQTNNWNMNVVFEITILSVYILSKWKQIIKYLNSVSQKN